MFRNSKALLGIALLTLLVLTACSGRTDSTGRTIGSKMTEEQQETVLSQIILEQNRHDYSEGECVAEGHIILSTEEVDASADTSEKTVIYALVSYGEYGFENGNFTKVSGSGVIPTRITLNRSGELLEYLQPRDGSEYAKSLQEMFPSSLWKRAMADKEDADYNVCLQQEHVYAEAYLKAIGRTAQIGEYRDFEHILPDIDTQVANALITAYSEYPYWVGTLEKLEGGTRYVYEKKWDSAAQTVTFVKYAYESGEIVTEAVVDAKTGNVIQ